LKQKIHLWQRLLSPKTSTFSHCICHWVHPEFFDYVFNRECAFFSLFHRRVGYHFGHSRHQLPAE
ncbi:MAG TPA: hypothetical protein VFH07_06770, partial [Chitinophagaceae bacterium]|nr:hypothetical protein [Chitinophagaceae bacterium]